MVVVSVDIVPEVLSVVKVLRTLSKTLLKALPTDSKTLESVAVMVVSPLSSLRTADLTSEGWLARKLLMNSWMRAPCTAHRTTAKKRMERKKRIGCACSFTCVVVSLLVLTRLFIAGSINCFVCDCLFGKSLASI